MSAATFAKVQSIQVGDVKITGIPDGGAYISATTMYPASSAEGWEVHKDLTDDQQRAVVSLGGFLIEAGGKKILMDLGYGPQTVEFPGFGPFIGGDYLKSLEAAGAAPEDITDVFYTHLHLDHVGWTSVDKDGKRELTFPNAQYWCSEAEWNYWPGDTSGLGPDPDNVLAPLTGVIRFAQDGQELAPGLTAHAAPGHTPGLTILKLEAGGKTVWFTADIFHCTVQFRERSWYAIFDIDHETGEVTRQKYLPEFVKEDTVLADAHFSNTVFGCLKEEDGKYLWTPYGA